MSNLRILLGGVPFGCNNIGDEAILAQVVNIVRESTPAANIIVSTGEQKTTAEWLDVETCPLHSSFSGNERDNTAFFDALDSADVFIWSGATGLSDYPNAALNCLSEAQNRGLKTIVFCTGMNDTFNPAHFKLNSGLKKSLFDIIKQTSGGKLDLTTRYECRKEQDVRTRLKEILDRCDLVINRDFPSKLELMKSNLSKQPIVAADPAIALPLVAPTAALWGDSMMEVLESGSKLIGVCISSQQKINQLDAFASWLDGLVDTYQAKIVFIPMNPITDFKLMSQIREAMFHRSQSIIASGSVKPSSVAGLASKMDVVISSRLHLLIFAAISSTPCIGIGRGSKVTNFLSE
ncbi:hypothetical protein A3767_19535, partial [Oleiphilus sp. HI0133]